VGRLARGYIGMLRLTARAFCRSVRARHAPVPDRRLRRWRARRTLEFVGRVDDQIKIRGFRVEPGEVASVLRSHPLVGDAVVLVAGQGAQRT